MLDILKFILALLVLSYSFLKSISYAIYEIQEEKNKVGGVLVIFLSTISILLFSFLLFLD